MNGFWVGFPGWMKSSVTSVFLGPVGQCQRNELRTVIDPQFFRITPEQRHPFHKTKGSMLMLKTRPAIKD